MNKKDENSNGLMRLDDFIFSKMAKTKLPSVAVSVVREKQVIHSRAFGFKDIDGATPAEIGTVYGIGSVSKSFTSLAVSKLVEEGYLNFHDRVADYIPSLSSRGLEEVELHHLLSHSSGIPGLGWAETLIYSAIGKTKNWLPISTADDMSSFLDDVKDWMVASPGSKYFYLNEGYFLLGEIISKVSGKPYAEYVRENILKPLHMNRTFFTRSEVENDGDFATPYTFDGGKAIPSVIPWQSQPAAGGIMSNVQDLSNYLIMYVNKGEFEGERILREETIEKMWHSYSRPPRSIFPDIGYGYGFFTTKQFFSKKLVYHGGSVSVYTSAIAFIPDEGIGISILANAEGYDPVLLCLYGLSILLDKDPEDSLLPLRIENALTRLEGTYKTYKGLLSARVSKNGDFLMLSGEDIGDHILVPTGSIESDRNHFTFFTLSGGARMEVEFRLSGPDIEMIFERYRYKKCGLEREM
ncbi:MAG: serine hydrolase [Thermoplasmatales archaeon]